MQSSRNSCSARAKFVRLGNSALPLFQQGPNRIWKDIGFYNVVPSDRTQTTADSLPDISWPSCSLSPKYMRLDFFFRSISMNYLLCLRKVLRVLHLLYGFGAQVMAVRLPAHLSRFESSQQNYGNFKAGGMAANGALPHHSTGLNSGFGFCRFMYFLSIK